MPRLFEDRHLLEEIRYLQFFCLSFVTGICNKISHTISTCNNSWQLSISKRNFWVETFRCNRRTFSYQESYPFPRTELEMYLDIGWKFKMELLVKIVKGFEPLSISAKSSFLDFPLGSECASTYNYQFVLTLSCRRFISYWNQWINLLCRSWEWLLNDRGLRPERVKTDHSFYWLLCY